MINLSQERPLPDLGERIRRYELANAVPIFVEEEFLVISGVLRRNKPLKEYIESGSSDKNLFENNLVHLMMHLSQDVSNILQGLYIGYTASNKFILIYHPDQTQYPIDRDNLISLICSRGINIASQYYKNPMCLIKAFQIPKEEVQHILAYYKMSWIARRNRILGELVLGIDSWDTTLSHVEILDSVQKQGYSLKNLNTTLLNGFSFSPHASLKNE